MQPKHALSLLIIQMHPYALQKGTLHKSAIHLKAYQLSRIIFPFDPTNYHDYWRSLDIFSPKSLTWAAERFNPYGAERNFCQHGSKHNFLTIDKLHTLFWQIKIALCKKLWPFEILKVPNQKLVQIYSFSGHTKEIQSMHLNTRSLNSVKLS